MSDDWEDQDLTIPVLSVQNEEQLKRLDERKLVEESDNALTKSLFSNEEDILKKDLEIKKQKHTFTEKKAPKQRRVYVGLQKELLESMDNHINDNICDKEFKPSNGFEKYCTEYVELLKIEINRLLKNGITDSEEIKNKIKKTYKNRYFMYIIHEICKFTKSAPKEKSMIN